MKFCIIASSSSFIISSSRLTLSIAPAKLFNVGEKLQIKTKIKAGVNPRKWICVGVDEKDVIVKNKESMEYKSYIKCGKYSTGGYRRNK